MEMKLLQCFVEVTKEKNISKVAEKHYISQPALSLQLKKLEEVYGTKLLDRTMRGVEPTAAGEILADYCKNILNLYNQSFEEIANLKKEHRTIRIESNLTLATYVLPVIVYQLQQQKEFVNCYFDLTFNTSTPVESGILSGLSHLGFVQSVKTNSNLIYKKVAEDHLTVVAAKDYAIPDKISLAELKEYPVIEVFDKFQERVPLKDTLATYNISMEDLNIVMSLHSTESVKTALFGKIGIAMLPHISVKKELNDGQLKAIEVEGFAQTYPVYLIYLKEKQYDSIQDETIKFLKDHTKAHF